MESLTEFASLQNLLDMAQAPPPAAPSYATLTQPPLQDSMYGNAAVGAPGGTAPAMPLDMQISKPSTQPAGQYDHRPLAVQDIGLFGQLIRRTESANSTHPDGYYQAKNPTTSASGAYQYIDRTWGRYGGYPSARLAPRQVQDAKFNEDALRKLRQFNGDIFRMAADHMLPAQANSPQLWTRPSVIMVHGKPVRIPPVADYVRKIIRDTPYAAEFENYLRAHGAPQ